MELPKRKSPRLQSFDYSSENYYFVTVCTHKKERIFGLTDELNQFGKLAENALLTVIEHFENVEVDRYVVMPNHVHAIIVIGSGDNKPKLSNVIGQYKSTVTREIHKFSPIIKVWQSSFYDHIIRNEDEYVRVCKYIDENRLKLKCLINDDM